MIGFFRLFIKYYYNRSYIKFTRVQSVYVLQETLIWSSELLDWSSENRLTLRRVGLEVGWIHCYLAS